MAETVLITVTGLTGSGKSAICGEIEIALRAIGVAVVWDDQGEKAMTHADWQTALDLYKPKVRIIEKNIPRLREGIMPDKIRDALKELANELCEIGDFEIEVGCSGEGPLVRAYRAMELPLPQPLKEWLEEADIMLGDEDDDEESVT